MQRRATSYANANVIPCKGSLAEGVKPVKAVSSGPNPEPATSLQLGNCCEQLKQFAQLTKAEKLWQRF